MFFLVKKREKKKITLFQMISSIEYLLNKNLFESSAADNAVAKSGFYYDIFFFFLLWCFFSCQKNGEKKERKEEWGGCVFFWEGDFLVAVEGYLPGLLR